MTSILRPRKILPWTVGAVVLYAVLGFLVAPPLVRSQLERALSEQLGRPATVGSVRINPFTLSASIRELAVKTRDGSANALGFEELSVDIALSSLVHLGVIVEAASLSKPYVRVVRGDDGKYDFQDVLDRFAAAPPAPAAPPGPPPKFAVYNIELRDGTLEFDDRPAKTRHVVTELQVGLPFFSSLPAEVDIVVVPRLSAKVNDTQIALVGETTPFKDKHVAKVRIDIDNLELARYLEYLPLRVRVPSGVLSTRLILTSTVLRGGRVEAIALSGTASLQRLAIQFAGGAPLAALARLTVDLESLDLLQRRATVKSVRIEAPEVDLARQKDGSFSLAALRPPSPAATPKLPAEAEPAPFTFLLERIALSDGTLRFADRVPPKPATMTLNGLSLDVERLGNAPGNEATLKLKALVNRSAPLEIAGKLNLVPGGAELDLDASAQAIDLQPMSPYSVMYAGYAIASGKLSLKHAIKLKDRKLATANNIRLDRFDFGERVESPTATRLPVLLAVAVLKDRDGVIAIDLPVLASLDDPQAGGGAILGREVGGFVSKAATAPFAQLGGEELAYLEFVPGSAKLEAGAEAKLNTLAKALYARPGLKLDVSGRADPGTDGAALKSTAGEALRVLAQARAQAVRDWLIEMGKLPAERTSIIAPKVTAEDVQDKGQPTRVDFALR